VRIGSIPLRGRFHGARAALRALTGGPRRLAGGLAHELLRRLDGHGDAQRSLPALDSRAPFGGQVGTLMAVETVLSILQILISVVVVFLVLMHSGKDAGLSGAFGVGSGAGPLGGGSLVERNLNRWTIFFSVLFFVNAIILLKRPWA
jgi:preprotein translocase subunit SecG